ncbi:LCP family protein [Patescibacteria group bacterium]
MNSQNKNSELFKIILLSLFLISAFAIIYKIIPITKKNPISSSSIINQNPTPTTQNIINEPNDVNVFTKPPQKKNISINIKNILILGRPGQGHSGSNLTDTIILAHLNPNKNKSILISLPRDLIIQAPKTKELLKINSLYTLTNIETLKSKIQEITGLTIDRYIVFDLNVAETIINLVDGLNVFVPQDIYDPYFPGPNYTYDPFSLKAGWRYLDGRNVLRYARTRYTSPNGDFDRMYRQQQVIRLLEQKILDLNPLWDFPTYIKIFNTLKNNILTDLNISEMNSIWQIAKNSRSENIETIVIDENQTNLLAGGMIPLGEVNAYVIWPKAGKWNYNDIIKYIQETINKL